MQSIDTESFWSVANLAKIIRQECLFVTNEKNNVRNLHETYEENYCKTLQIAWICAHQRQILNSLILARPDFSPSESFSGASMLTNAKFVDIYKSNMIKYPYTSSIAELINYLYESPGVLANCLSIADRSDISINHIDTVVGFIVNGLYNSITHSKDAKMITKLLQMLIEFQIVISDAPRRLLRSGSSSFTCLYQKYHESSFAPRIFLKSILYEPIMSVLIRDEVKLEIDPHKVIAVQSVAENLKMFGDNTSSEYATTLQLYKQQMINRLYVLVSQFVKSICDNWCLLPTTLRWLSQSMCHFLTKAKFSKEDVNIIITDMIFTNFICPAILSPNIYGIVDAPISENTRFNLNVIGQVLQALALIEYQPIDEKLKELFSRLDQNCISDLLKQMHQAKFVESFEYNAATEKHNTFKVVLITHNELAALINLLTITVEQDGLHFPLHEKSKIKQILTQFPDLNEIKADIQEKLNNSPSYNVGTKPKSKLRNRLSKARSLNNSPFQYYHESEHKSYACNNNNYNNNDTETVFIIPLSINETKKILTEEELLNTLSGSIQAKGSPEPYVEQMNMQHSSNKMVIPDTNERGKPKCFVLPQDDASIGNTSDNLEVVSEAHSNHSVASSLELEEVDQNYNDNLSDMISANVSGRGTPNISGRDTPSSQVTEGGEAQQFATPQMTKILNKTRSDIEDKFCKFEIKKLIEGDETISIISDTWSTDVLASDSEAVEANERNFSTPLIPTTPLIPGDHNYNPLANSFGQLRITSVDVETQSESAWSTDAIVDVDDIQSVVTRPDATDSITRDNDIHANLNSTLMDTSFCASKTSHQKLLSTTVGLLSQNQSNCRNITMESKGDISSNSTSKHFSNCLQPNCLPARQSSTDSYNSTSGSDGKARSSSSDTNEKFNISNVEKTSNYKFDTNKDKNTNNSKCIVQTDMSNAGAECALSSKNLLNPFVEMLDCSFPMLCNTSMDSNSSLTFQSTVDQSDNNSLDDELAVEHRRLSSEQRNAKFDSRRNGMIDIVGNITFSSPFSSTDECLDREMQFTPLNSIHNDTSMTDAMACFSQTNLPNLPSCHKSTQFANRAFPLSGTNSENNFILYNVETQCKQNDPRSATKFFTKPTGTIPKNPSRTDSLKAQSGILTKIKLGFKNRRSSHISSKLRFNAHVFPTHSDGFSLNAGNSVIANTSDMLITSETTEDILAKYRRKTSTSSETAASDSTSNNSSSNKSKTGDIDQRKSTERSGSEYSPTFDAAKRYLRSVLSSTEIFSTDFEQYSGKGVTPLIMYLRILQAQALSSQNVQQLSCISELFRCLKPIEPAAHNLLLKELQNDVINREAYIKYLINCRQTLLSSIDNLSSFKFYLEEDSKTTIRQIVMICVKMFIEKKESSVQQFRKEFVQLTVVDERKDLLQEFLSTLMDELKTNAVLGSMTDWQTCEARNCMECILLYRLYDFVMFPNDEGDILRDDVLHEHIGRLAKSITPSHAQLRIPLVYIQEAPWLYAQRQLSFMSAYKTPLGKVECVIKCIKSLLSLLSMGSGSSIPAADDIIPVLIYVIIQSNPRNLLSTIEYVNCFFGDTLTGEKEYWWTQFCSAVTFIKTMDYCE
ncbi:receptor-mediated endocytosis protein 6 homolog isoform X2 [Wyeomyia smithii]|uniref:receptor-mediated endocytosis protein 6 homolog isoform X2 n=1 Tax=Wyeomyia smithii TaxID=174621 RepID=UPI002467EA6F|nr:receptor-mediated endocytosis protein 6 homolog isoform X2 [Wyeomyia smithii]